MTLSPMPPIAPRLSLALAAFLLPACAAPPAPPAAPPAAPSPENPKSEIPDPKSAASAEKPAMVLEAEGGSRTGEVTIEKGPPAHAVFKAAGGALSFPVDLPKGVYEVAFVGRGAGIRSDALVYRLLKGGQELERYRVVLLTPPSPEEGEKPSDVWDRKDFPLVAPEDGAYEIRVEFAEPDVALDQVIVTRAEGVQPPAPPAQP